jgi:hypothetical protein
MRDARYDKRNGPRPARAAAENDPKNPRKFANPQGRTKEEIRKTLQYQCRIKILARAHHRLDLGRDAARQRAHADWPWFETPAEAWASPGSMRSGAYGSSSVSQ